MNTILWPPYIYMGRRGHAMESTFKVGCRCTLHKRIHAGLHLTLTQHILYIHACFMCICIQMLALYFLGLRKTSLLSYGKYDSLHHMIPSALVMALITTAVIMNNDSLGIHPLLMPHI